MNYANMIEEKNLKKGFIIATLLSTVIGTFTASMTLHDKVSEKRAKKKQAATDKGQNEQIQEMKEKLEKLQKGGDGGGGGGEGEKKKEDGGEKEGKKERSRSRSRPPRRRELEEDDDDAYFAQNAAKSKDLIERTYQDHLQKIGPKYARGDLITENMLQAQVIQLQQTVIGVLQDALYNGRSLSEEDMKRLIAAQNTARDGSIEALQGQYERMLAMEKKSAGVAPAPSPPGKVVQEIMPPPPPRETLADYGIPPQKRESGSLRGSPIPIPRGAPPQRESYVPEAALAGGAAGLAAGLAGGSRSRHGSPPPKSTKTEAPQSRKDSAGPEPRDYHDAPASRAPKTEAGGGGGPKSTKTEVGKSSPEDKGKSTMGERPKSTMGDRPKSMIGERPKSVMGDAGKSVKGDAAKSTKGEAPKSNKTELNGPTKTAPNGGDINNNNKNDSKSTKPEPPKSRLGGKDPYAEGMPPKEWYPPKKTRSHDPAPPPTLYASPPLPPPTQKARSASPKRHPPQKALPEAPEGELFCKYSLTLQDSKLPLHSSFSGTGNHRCPSCKVLVPVDVRDVWVISTDSSSPKTHHSKHQKSEAEDYRMDARFVVKCHTATNQKEGGFACVLCDKYRDLDCICKSVDALVKHVGSAHGPEEYERDGDLHRMKRGSNVRVNGREFVLA